MEENKGQSSLGKMSLHKLIEKAKNIKKDQLLIILLVGVLLVVISLPTGSGTQSKQTDETETPALQTEAAARDSDYVDELEKKLVNILTGVENVGEVDVMITLKTKGEANVEKDASTSSSVTEETDSQGGTRRSEDITNDEVTVYVEDENGNQVPYISSESLPEIQGIVISAEGGDNAVVVKEITEAVKALFQVEAHKIKVMKKS